MIIPLLFLIQKPADGLQRFHDFIGKNKSFSVQLVAHSTQSKVVGKGSYVVVNPASFRLAMNWGGTEYFYIKSPSQSVDYDTDSKIYQQYPARPGKMIDESPFFGGQLDSMPLPLLRGDLKLVAPTKFKLVSQQSGSETYAATWTNMEGSGKASATVATDGRLLQFDFSIKSTKGTYERSMEFSNYVFNPPIPKNTFTAVPPIGYTCFAFPFPEPSINTGSALHFGKWMSKAGRVDIDSPLRGKLVIVRASASPPADALIAYLAKQSLPVRTVVVSLGNSGGSYWSPSPEIAAKLWTVGTPLMILIGSDGKVRSLWMGFDSESASTLVTQIAKAVAEKPGA